MKSTAIVISKAVVEHGILRYVQSANLKYEHAQCLDFWHYESWPWVLLISFLRTIQTDH